MKLLNVIIVLAAILIVFGGMKKNIKLFDNNFNWRAYLETLIGKPLGYKKLNLRVYENYTNDSVFKNISDRRSLFINTMPKKFKSCNIKSKNIFNEKDMFNKKYNRCIIYGVDENDGSPVKYIKKHFHRLDKNCGEVEYLKTGTRAIIKDLVNLEDKKKCNKLINKIEY